MAAAMAFNLRRSTLAGTLGAEDSNILSEKVNMVKATYLTRIKAGNGRGCASCPASLIHEQIIDNIRFERKSNPESHCMAIHAV
jgi:hypothetical protein